MPDFTIDCDPLIPTGINATPEQVAGLVADGILPADKVAELVTEQQPEDLKAAVADAVDRKVAGGAKKEDFAGMLAEVDSVVAVDVKPVEEDLGVVLSMPKEDRA